MFAQWLCKDSPPNSRTTEDIRRNVEVFLNALLPGADPTMAELLMPGEIDNGVIDGMLATAEYELETLVERALGAPDTSIGMIKEIILPAGTNIIILLTEA